MEGQLTETERLRQEKSTLVMKIRFAESALKKTRWINDDSSGYQICRCCGVPNDHPQMGVCNHSPDCAIALFDMVKIT